MDIYDDFPGAFFKATELTGKRLTVTIAGVEKREMNDGKIKPVLSLRGGPAWLGAERREPHRLGGPIWA